jgi:hypothetical protein
LIWILVDHSVLVTNNLSILSRNSVVPDALAGRNLNLIDRDIAAATVALNICAAYLPFIFRNCWEKCENLLALRLSSCYTFYRYYTNFLWVPKKHVCLQKLVYAKVEYVF